jgi:predicted nucleotidyltransferase component of viral defense system
MEQELTALQQNVLHEVVANPALASFYLSGGTALSAFHLHHRLSDDLDFFCSEAVDIVAVRAFMQHLSKLFAAKELRYERLHDRHLYFLVTEGEELKMEFTQYSFPRLGDHEVINGLKIDDLRDIATNKMMALLDRFDPKDFVDLYFLLADYSLDQLRKDVEQKFGLAVGSVFLGGELMKSERIEALPRMLKPLTLLQLKSFFKELAGSLTAEVME